MNNGIVIGDRSIDAVVFDCDGVLVDSERLELHVMVDAFGWLSIEADAEALQNRNRGGAMADVIADFERLNGAPLPEGFVERYRTRQLEGLREVQPVPGALPTVAAVEACGLSMAIASGGPMAKMEVTLPRVGLWDRFAPHIYSCYDLESGAHKPEPDVYLKAAAALGIEPQRCLVFEDSINGVGAGAAAGMYVVGLARDVDAAALRAAGAQATVTHLDQAETLFRT